MDMFLNRNQYWNRWQTTRMSDITRRGFLLHHQQHFCIALLLSVIQENNQVKSNIVQNMKKFWLIESFK